MPELTAHTEATVAAVYAHIFSMIVMEIESPPESGKVDGWDDPGDIDDAFAWRRLALAAYLEGDGEPKASGTATNEVDGRVPGDHDEDNGLWSPPEISLECIEEWEFLVGECLANRILWADGDHEAGPGFMDADPAVSRSSVCWRRCSRSTATVLRSRLIVRDRPPLVVPSTRWRRTTAVEPPKVTSAASRSTGDHRRYSSSPRRAPV